MGSYPERWGTLPALRFLQLHLCFWGSLFCLWSLRDSTRVEEDVKNIKFIIELNLKRIVKPQFNISQMVHRHFEDVSDSLVCTSWSCRWKVDVGGCLESGLPGTKTSALWIWPQSNSPHTHNDLQGHSADEAWVRHGGSDMLHKHIQLQRYVDPWLWWMPTHFQISSSRYFIHIKIDLKNVCLPSTSLTF